MQYLRRTSQSLFLTRPPQRVPTHYRTVGINPMITILHENPTRRISLTAAKRSFRSSPLLSRNFRSPVPLRRTLLLTTTGVPRTEIRASSHPITNDRLPSQQSTGPATLSLSMAPAQERMSVDTRMTPVSSMRPALLACHAGRLALPLYSPI